MNKIIIKRKGKMFRAFNKLVPIDTNWCELINCEIWAMSADNVGDGYHSFFCRGGYYENERKAIKAYRREMQEKFDFYGE